MMRAPEYEFQVAFDKTVALHAKLLDVVQRWLDGLEPGALTVAEGIKVLELLAKNQEKLAELRKGS